MQGKHYFSIENGKDVQLEKMFDKVEAIERAKEISATEVFEFTEEDELVGCVWSASTDQRTCTNCLREYYCDWKPAGGRQCCDDWKPEGKRNEEERAH